MDIRSLFNPLESLEENAAHLYSSFSRKLDALPGASMLFYRMGLEEKAHLALVRYQRRVVMANPDLFKEVDLDLKEVKELARRVNAEAKSSRATSLERAVAVALEMEGSLAESHYRIAILDARPELSSLIWSLNLADKMHLGSLREFAARNGLAGLL